VSSAFTFMGYLERFTRFRLTEVKGKNTHNLSEVKGRKILTLSEVKDKSARDLSEVKAEKIELPLGSEG
jgi:hypothetical protein